MRSIKGQPVPDEEEEKKTEIYDPGHVPFDSLDLVGEEHTAAGTPAAMAAAAASAPPMPTITPQGSQGAITPQALAATAKAPAPQIAQGSQGAIEPPPPLRRIAPSAPTQPPPMRDAPRGPGVAAPGTMASPARRQGTMPPPLPSKSQPMPAQAGQPPQAAALPMAPIVARSAKPADRPGTAPIQAVSMKNADGKPSRAERRKIPSVKLRPIGSIDSGAIAAPKGRLAPPIDAREARKQRLMSNTFWASIAVIIASLVALAIWLIAGKK